jgi:hypothetical protein
VVFGTRHNFQSSTANSDLTNYKWPYSAEYDIHTLMRELVRGREDTAENLDAFFGSGASTSAALLRHQQESKMYWGLAVLPAGAWHHDMGKPTIHTMLMHAYLVRVDDGYSGAHVLRGPYRPNANMNDGFSDLGEDVQRFLFLAKQSTPKWGTSTVVESAE